MGTKANEEDAFVLIEELKKKVEEFEEAMGERNRQRAFDRRRIKELELYIKAKSNTNRNDFDILAVQLMKEVINRKKGLDYKTVMKTFNFESPTEAYRLMDRTVKNFPLDVKIKSIKNSSRKKRLIVRLGGVA